jgi:hypothetical protein
MRAQKELSRAILQHCEHPSPLLTLWTKNRKSCEDSVQPSMLRQSALSCGARVELAHLQLSDLTYKSSPPIVFAMATEAGGGDTSSEQRIEPWASSLTVMIPIVNEHG